MESHQSREHPGFGLAVDQPRRGRAISVRITTDEHALLRVLANQRGQTVSDTVRGVLTSALRSDHVERAA